MKAIAIILLSIILELLSSSSLAQINIGGSTNFTGTINLQPASASSPFTRYSSIAFNTPPSSNLTNFPVLINLSDNSLKSVGNGGSVQSSDGYDIVFGLDSKCAVRLSFERESYNPTAGTFLGWVLLPTFSSTAPSPIYACYGRASITSDQQNSPIV